MPLPLEGCANRPAFNCRDFGYEYASGGAVCASDQIADVHVLGKTSNFGESAAAFEIASFASFRDAMLIWQTLRGCSSTVEQRLPS
jgi:hypothetical protein